MIVTSVPELIWLVWLFWIPESPRWQMTHDKIAEARENIRKAATLNGVLTENFEQDFETLLENMEKVRK